MDRAKPTGGRRAEAAAHRLYVRRGTRRPLHSTLHAQRNQKPWGPFSGHRGRATTAIQQFAPSIHSKHITATTVHPIYK